MSHVTVIQNHVAEETTALITATLTDEFDNPISVAGLDSAKFTLYDAVTGAIINSRTDVNVLANIDTAGKLTLTLTPADTALLSQSNSRERRVAYFEWVYANDTKIGRHEVRFTVQNMDKVT